MSEHIVSIDQGTTSTRAIVFNRAGQPIGSSQREHEQIFPHAGWVEHDPKEIWANTRVVIDGALDDAGLRASDIRAVGITNQRETAVVWDLSTGEPVYNAIVWQDTRTQDIVDEVAGDHGHQRFHAKTGLPLATYFSASKITWILDNVEGVRQRAEAGDLAFGTMDTWLLWNLTGGVNGGVHATDVTNASRTLLVDLESMEWDAELLDAFRLPSSLLPEIRRSSGEFSVIEAGGTVAGIPVAGILGDQQAATFGQAAFSAGESKNTYGTGNFLLLNTGEERVVSTHGLLTTPAYQLAEGPVVWALEGSIAVTGSLIQWLRDNLGLISSAAEVESLAASVEDSGGAYFVPAFSGLFAPYWRSDARGVIVGLTRYITKAHIARAALEATALQTREVLDAMNSDSGTPLVELKVDGGMTANNLLMQFQADIVGIPVVRPKVPETTALGAAYAAGLATGLWSSLDELRSLWEEESRFVPQMSDQDRDEHMRMWRKAPSKSLDWVD